MASRSRGAGQRACCIFEGEGACDTVLSETPQPDAGECGSLLDNAALRPDYGTNLDLVSKDDGALGPPSCPGFLPLCGTYLFHGDRLLLGAGSDQIGAGTARNRSATSGCGRARSAGASATSAGWSPRWSPRCSRRC